MTIEEAREVALDVFRSNAIELRGIAQAMAVTRAEELTNEYFEKLERDMPERASKLADPDVQSVLFEAQKEYARSGEEDLKIALVELLAARSGEEGRNLRTLALNEAIASAPKLTEAQRRAIAWIFYLRYTRDTGSGTPAEYFKRVSEVVDALGVDIPTGYADYQHIEYVGAGSIGISSVSFGIGLLTGVEGLFTLGFVDTDVDPALLGRLKEKNFAIPAIRDPNRLQLPLLAEEELDDKMATLGLSADTAAVRPLMSIGRMSDTEIADETMAVIPAIARLRACWDEGRGAIHNMTLTSVGIAIGHAYWCRLTARTPSLSIWLP